MSSGENPAEPAMEPTVAVYTAPDSVTAGLVCSLLEAEGIPAFLGEQVTSMYAGAFSVGEGFFGEIRVPVSDEAGARAVLDEFVNRTDGTQPFTDEELSAAADASSSPEV